MDRKGRKDRKMGISHKKKGYKKERPIDVSAGIFLFKIPLELPCKTGGVLDIQMAKIYGQRRNMRNVDLKEPRQKQLRNSW